MDINVDRQLRSTPRTVCSPTSTSGIVLPIVSTSMHGRSNAQIHSVRGPTAAHFFAGTTTNPVLAASRDVTDPRSDSGRTSRSHEDRPASVGAHQPRILRRLAIRDGRPEQLLGAGQSTTRALAILSGRFGTFSPMETPGYIYRLAKHPERCGARGRSLRQPECRAK